jgi:hypothetical protein
MHKHRGKHGHKHWNGKIEEGVLVKVLDGKHFKNWIGQAVHKNGRRVEVDFIRDRKKAAVVGAKFLIKKKHLRVVKRCKGKK